MQYRRPQRYSLASRIREMLTRDLPPKEIAGLLNIHVDRVYSVKAIDKRRARRATGGPAVVIPKDEEEAMRTDLRLIVRAIKREFHDEPQRAYSLHSRPAKGGR
jgi:phosphoribosylpyrophosphate synthetase